MPPPTVAAPPPGPPQDPLATPLPGSAMNLRNDVAYPRPDDLSYGMALRFRWVSIPSSMLGVFTKKNMPVTFKGTPAAYALEVFRRKANFDMGVAVGYQALMPDDGNWLGTGKKAADDTDFVQFRSFGIITMDIAFVWHSMFTDWIGMHYGAGIGAGFTHGKILRTSSFGCTDDNLGDLSKCAPRGITCTSNSCAGAEELLIKGEGKDVDTPENPHRFTENSVPAVIPIINAQIGLDFRVPSLRGWEAKIETGFYDAFFVGGGVGYTF
jgi:hypothetical protein